MYDIREVALQQNYLTQCNKPSTLQKEFWNVFEFSMLHTPIFYLEIFQPLRMKELSVSILQLENPAHF